MCTLCFQKFGKIYYHSGDFFKISFNSNFIFERKYRIQECIETFIVIIRLEIKQLCVFCILQDIKTPILPIFSYFGWSISKCIKCILYHSTIFLPRACIFFRHGLRAVGAHYTVLFDAEQLVTTFILKNIEYSLS